MCSAPRIPEPEKPRELQQSQTPVYRDGMLPRMSGRRGTILVGGGRPTGMSNGSVGGQSGGAMQPTSVAPRRTVLGG